MGVQGPEGPKGPAGPIGPAGKDAIVDYSKITSDSSLKDSIKSLILTDASFNAMITEFINDNASKFQGPVGKTVFSSLTNDEKSQVIASLLEGSNIDSLILGLGNSQVLKTNIETFIRKNTGIFIPEDGIFRQENKNFQDWLGQYNKSTLYCADGKCIIPTGDSMNPKSNILSQWSLRTDDSAVRFRYSDKDKVLINNDGGLNIEGNVEVKGGINVNTHLRARGGILGRESDNEIIINGVLRFGNWRLYQDGNFNIHHDNGTRFTMKADGDLTTNQDGSVNPYLRKGYGIRLRNTKDPGNRYLKRDGNWGTGITDQQAGKDEDWTVWVPE